MRNEGPSGPSALNLGQREPGASADSQTRSETPTWPGAEERRRRAVEARQAPGGRVSALALGISLGANLVLLVALIGLLMLAQAGAFSSGGAFGQSTSGLPLGSPTTTASPASSPSPGAGLLQIAPSSVQLGCSGGQRTRLVTLTNSGTERAQWKATFSLPAQQTGVAISPSQGELEAGDSVQIQIQNTTRSNGSQGSSGRQGVITFTPTTNDGADAGAPATLAYTTQGCH